MLLIIYISDLLKFHFGASNYVSITDERAIYVQREVFRLWRGTVVSQGTKHSIVLTQDKVDLRTHQ